MDGLSERNRIVAGVLVVLICGCGSRSALEALVAQAAVDAGVHDAAPCTADVSSDPHNCGACGHDCLGGACLAGSCQPVVVATSAQGNIGVAVNASGVFWTSEDGNVRTVPLAGGPVTTLASAQPALEGIAVDATRVYWVTGSSGGGTVTSLPVGGSTPSVIAGGQGRPEALTIDATTVYWTTNESGTVASAPLGGGPVTVLASGLDHPYGIAVDASFVYWTNAGSMADAGAVMRVAIGGGTPDTLSLGRSYPWHLAVDATSVYWLESDGNQPTSKPSLMKMPKDGGSPVTLAVPPPTFVSGIVVDATRVYWTGSSKTDGYVMAVPLGGGAATTLANNQADPLGLAEDATSIYWVDYGPSGPTTAPGSVMRLAK
jgi:hypothetical protein